MYGRGHIGVLEGLIELRTRPLFAKGLQEEHAALLCEGQPKGMHMVNAGS